MVQLATNYFISFIHTIKWQQSTFISSEKNKTTIWVKMGTWIL